MRGSRNFFREGGGGVKPDGQKTVWMTLLFLILNLFYSLQRGSNGFITEKTILFQGSRGGPTFSRGVQMLISIETHITCDYSGGFGPPIPPLDLHMYIFHKCLGANCARAAGLPIFSPGLPN